MSDLCSRGFLEKPGAAVFVLLIFLGATTKSPAQDSSPYLYQPTPFASSAPSSAENGYVEQVNGHLHLEFPLGNSLPERGGKNASHRLVYDSNFWGPSTLSGFPSPYSMKPTSFGGWSTLPVQPSIVAYGQNEIIYSDARGVLHGFPTNVGGANVFASDSSGYYMLANVRFSGDTGVEVYSPDGSMEYSSLPVNGGTRQYQQAINTIDPNGNYQGTCMVPDSGGIHVSDRRCDSLGRVDFLYYYTSPTPISSSGPLDYNYYYQYPNAQGSMSTVEVDYVQINIASNFQIPGWRDCTGTTCLMWVAKRILEPDGTSYQFLYDCDPQNSYHREMCSSPDGLFYGEITQMTLPTGGVIQYQYQMFHDVYGAPSRWIKQKTAPSTGTTTYTPAILSNCTAGQVGCRQSLTVTKDNGVATTTTFVVDNGSWPVQISSGDTTTTLSFDMTNPCVEVQCVGHDYIRKLKEVTRQSGSEGTVVTEKQYAYESKESGLVTQVKEWRYAASTGDPDSSLLPTTVTSTQYYSPVSSPGSAAASTSAGGTNIHRPASVTVCSGSGKDPLCIGGGTLLSRTVYAYDESAPTIFTGAANHLDNAYGATMRARGNPTTISRWIQGSQYTVSHVVYDTTGQVLSTVDALGHTTTFDYSDSFLDDAGASGATPRATAAPTHAYATTVGSASPPLTTKRSYYFGTGAIASQTDPNGQIYSWHYDQLGRMTGVNLPLGWQLFSYPSATETDSYAAVDDKTPSLNCTRCKKVRTLRDAFGRASATMVADSSGGFVETDIRYDTLGRVDSVSHPYRTSELPQWDNFSYDTKDRVTAITHPDKSQQKWIFANGAGSATPLPPLPDGLSHVRALDESGNGTDYWYDVAGAILQVKAAGGTTTYGYDAAGNLTSVQQLGTSGEDSRQRAFTYNGLFQLVTAQNPETGTTCYGRWAGSNCQGGYDGNGNLLFKTDGSNTTVAYTYDTLNRLLTKSLGSTSACYSYDSSATTNGVGRLSAEWTQSGSCASSPSAIPGSALLSLRKITAYDAMGRESTYTSCILANCLARTRSQAYLYDLAGDMVGYTDGRGGTSFAPSYDSSGRLQQIVSSWNDASHPGSLMQVNSFGASGWLTRSVGTKLSQCRVFDPESRISGMNVVAAGGPPCLVP